jgi:serine/threonine protein kinase
VIVKIADLEVSGADTDNTMLPDCPYWLAPELLASSGPHSRSTTTDVYALAIVLAEVLSGLTPFASVNSRKQLVPFILSGGRPALPNTIPFTLKDAIHACWHPNAASRLSAAHLRSVVERACTENPSATPTSPPTSPTASTADPPCRLPGLEELSQIGLSINQ